MKNKFFSILQPKGVVPILLIQVFYSIGFFILFSNLTLYSANVLNVSDHTAYHISSTFLALVYALAVLGGYLSNRFFGYTYAFVFAVILCSLGFAFLLIKEFSYFYLGLAMIALADGIAIPTIYILLGSLYSPNNPLKTSGFIFAYIGMNIGSLIGAACAGPVAEHFGYASIFLLSLFFTLMTLLAFSAYLSQKKSGPCLQHADNRSLLSKILGTLIVLCLIPFIALIIKHPEWSNTILISFGLLAFFIIFYIGKKNPLARKSMRLFFFLCILYIIFWVVYFIIPTVLPLFIHRNVARTVLGMTIPAASFYAINPVTIILFGPLTGLLWIYLAKKNILSSIPAKFALGLFIIGIGYLTLSLGVLNQNIEGFVSWIWVVLTYFILTIGELCIGPIGYAMVGDVAPQEYEGLMMGIWQLMAGVASVVTNSLMQYIDHTDGKIMSPLLTNPSYLTLFFYSGIAVMLVAIITAFILKLKNGTAQ